MALEPARANVPEPRRPFLGWFPTEAERRVYQENTDALVAATRLDNGAILMRRKRHHTDALADVIGQRIANSDNPLDILSAERDYAEWLSLTSLVLQSYMSRPL